MKIEKIKALELDFLSRYPGGFEHPDMIKAGKKHKMGKQTEYIKNVCTIENLQRGSEVFIDVCKVVTSSSLVSVFEKMRFRDLMGELDHFEKDEFVFAVYELIHGTEKEGFNRLVNLLQPYKLAKWPIISVFRVYYYPNEDVLMKPTVVKKVLKYFEITDIKYTTTPDFAFYKKYQTYINKLKKEVPNSLRPNNPAFTGFLMLSIN